MPNFQVGNKVLAWTYDGRKIVCGNVESYKYDINEGYYYYVIIDIEWTNTPNAEVFEVREDICYRVKSCPKYKKD